MLGWVPSGTNNVEVAFAMSSVASGMSRARSVSKFKILVLEACTLAQSQTTKRFQENKNVEYKYYKDFLVEHYYGYLDRM
jgi:hypothetical protein